MDSTSSTLNVTVRTVAEMLYRSGDLSSIQFGAVTGTEGIRLHQKVYSKIEDENPNAAIYPETDLNTFCEYQNILLKVSGRTDCIVIPKTNDVSSSLSIPVIYEIKSHNKLDVKYDDLLRDCHLAQLKIYGHMFLCKHTELVSVSLCMRYVSIHTIEYLEKIYTFSKSELESFFDASCKMYIEYARQRMDYITLRNKSVQSLVFPYDGLRDGQKELMRRVISTIKNKQVLFAQAPTGVGKTVSVLYPAIKALPHKWHEKIFYLTAKKATRDVAQNSLNDMRKHGLYLRSILLSSKELMCPVPEIFCEPRECPFAIGYYDRRKDALKAFDEIFDVTPAQILKVAEKHRVCPHELSLDLSLQCDVIIGDYNHAFHPRIRLDRFFGNDAVTHLLLIDEAHNLVERARDMYSADMRHSRWKDFESIIHGLDRRIDGHTADILSYFDCMAHYMREGVSAFIHTEKNIENEPTFIATDFQAITATPKTLYASLWRLCFHLSKHLDNLSAKYDRKKILDVYFDARFFIHILEHYFDSSYIYSCKKHSTDDIILSVQNLDAAEKIQKIISNRHSAVFFSATLSPAEYYQSMLLGKDNEIADHLVLESPFSREHFKPIIYTGISTAYQHRTATQKDISNIVIKLFERIKGHYICFFPSFSYMQMIYKNIYDKLEKNNQIDLIIQKPEMSEEEKITFLSRFNYHGKKTLLAFAVLGGHFAEGIDLVGDKLNGVIIIGAGLPQVSPEREIIMQYYQEKFHDGFAYAYRYPGWEKVLQASGRVIRDEDDTGFALLIDHRYDSPAYRNLLPKHWKTYFAENPDDIVDYISDLSSG